MTEKLSEKYARQFALYNGLLEKIESEFEHLEPAWNPEGGWYPDGFRSNDPYRAGKPHNRLNFWLNKTYLEVDYQDGEAFLSVTFDHKAWTDEEIQQRENNPLLVYFEPFLKAEELDYLVRELNYYWGLGRPE